MKKRNSKLRLSIFNKWLLIISFSLILFLLYAGYNHSQFHFPTRIDNPVYKRDILYKEAASLESYFSHTGRYPQDLRIGFKTEESLAKHFKEYSEWGLRVVYCLNEAENNWILGLAVCEDGQEVTGRVTSSFFAKELLYDPTNGAYSEGVYLLTKDKYKEGM